MKCAHCGKEFERQHTAQKYCGAECSKIAKRASWRRYRARNKEKIYLSNKMSRWRKAGLVK